MKSCKFPSTYTIISGLLDDVNNSEQKNFELCHSCIKRAIYNHALQEGIPFQEIELMKKFLRTLLVYAKDCSLIITNYVLDCVWQLINDFI